MDNQSVMRLKSLEINNFRCFQSYKIEDFGSEVTIFIGKNGAGKTTLLNAAKKCLSFIFADYKDIKSITNGVKGVKVHQFCSLDGYYNWQQLEYTYPISIIAYGNFQDTLLPRWELTKKSEGGGLSTSLYKEALIEFYQRYKLASKYPLLAYYSDSFPHIGTRISPYAKRILKSGRPIPRAFGYYQWGEDTSCSEIWEIRWRNAFQNYNALVTNKQNLELQLGELYRQVLLEKSRVAKNKDPQVLLDLESSTSDIRSKISDIDISVLNWNQEKEYILNIIKNFINVKEDNFIDIKDIFLEYRSESAFLVAKFKDGSQRTFQELPAGFKRLLSIVLDIGYRAFLLTRGEEMPSGIVMIDEIDLHLHPSLEQNVVERFKQTFPQIQFIITTHSPLVISNFRQDDNNKIIVMKEYGNEFSNYQMPNLYGVDYSTVVRDAMEVESAPSEIQEMVNDFLYLLEKKELKRAESFLRNISSKYGAQLEGKVKIMAKQQLDLFE